MAKLQTYLRAKTNIFVVTCPVMYYGSMGTGFIPLYPPSPEVTSQSVLLFPDYAFYIHSQGSRVDSMGAAMETHVTADPSTQNTP